MKTSFGKSLLTATALSTFWSAAALAQSAATPAGDSDGLEDIIVTANKREENAQKVPAAVATISQETITRRGVRDINDINRALPEVSVFGSTNLTSIAIRGVGSLAFGPTTESPSAVHLDGAYVSRLTSLQALFFDVQRVEVLAGPQGTLYGRNSAAGTLNIITNKPTQELGGYASFEYGNYDTKIGNAAINVPITETVAARVAYFHNDRDGYYNNSAFNVVQNAVRGSILFKPSADDSLLLTADRQSIRGGQRQGNPIISEVLKNPTILTCNDPTGCPSPNPFDPRRAAFGSVSSVPAGTPGGVIVPIRLSSGRDDARTLLGNLDQSRQVTDTGGYMGQYDHDFGWATLTAQASYRYVHFNWTNGTLTGYAQDPRLVAVGIARPPAPNSFENGNAQENTQEIRLTSPSSQNFTYVVGAFRFFEKSYGNELGSFRTDFGNSAGKLGTFTFPNPPVVNVNFANPYQRDEAYAVFGQATFSPMGPVGLHLTGGLRYNTETKTSVGFTILNGQRDPNNDFNGRIKDDGLTYKANISYDLTERNLVYFDHSTGFAAGGFSFGINPRYDKNTISAFEVGTKNSFFNNRLIVNASAWHYDYKNIPVIVPLFFRNNQTGFPAFSVTTATAARAKLDGATLAVIAQPTPDDRLSGNVTYINGRYKSFDLTSLFAFGVANGLQPGATPTSFIYDHTPIGLNYDWAANASYNHIFHVFGGELDAQASVIYTGKRLLSANVAANDTNNQIYSRPLATLDFSLAYRPNGGKFSVTAYVRNIVDARVPLTEGYTSNAALLPVSDPRVQYAYRTVNYTAPRTFGLIGRVNF